MQSRHQQPNLSISLTQNQCEPLSSFTMPRRPHPPTPQQIPTAFLNQIRQNQGINNNNEYRERPQYNSDDSSSGADGDESGTDDDDSFTSCVHQRVTTTTNENSSTNTGGRGPDSNNNTAHQNIGNSNRPPISTFINSLPIFIPPAGHQQRQSSSNSTSAAVAPHRISPPNPINNASTTTNSATADFGPRRVLRNNPPIDVSVYGTSNASVPVAVVHPHRVAPSNPINNTAPATASNAIGLGQPRRVSPNNPSFGVSAAGGSAAPPPFSRSVNMNHNENQRSNHNFIPLNDDFMAIGDRFTGRCQYVKYDKDTTPLREVLNVNQFGYEFVIERAVDGVKVTYTREGRPTFSHWLSYPIDYSSAHARYLANNTLPGMSTGQVTIDVMFESQVDCDQFVRAYQFGMLLDTI